MRNVAVAGLMALAAGAGVASASPVLIVNAGFETPALDDSGVIFSAPGWVTFGDAGTFDPHAAAFAAGAPEGENVAFASRGVTLFSQVLAATAQANTLHTLTMLVGNRLDTPFGGYQIDLWAGNTLLGRDDNSLLPDDGAFLVSTIQSFVAPGSAAIGSALEIRFRSLDWQIVFDDVRLDAVERRAVPEPGVAVLFFVACASLAVRRRVSQARPTAGAGGTKSSALRATPLPRRA
jgi:hypothetical protein